VFKRLRRNGHQLATWRGMQQGRQEAWCWVGAAAVPAGTASPCCHQHLQGYGHTRTHKLDEAIESSGISDIVALLSQLHQA
jgi:hypothetical protein